MHLNYTCSSKKSFNSLFVYCVFPKLTAFFPCNMCVIITTHLNRILLADLDYKTIDLDEGKKLM